MEDERVTVVVMSRDRRDELLRSLPRHAAPVLLVDNGSTDGTAAAVRQRLPHVPVVELPRNRGALARNIGVALARTPFVAFADDDSWWRPGALREAAALLAAHPRVAVVAARVLVGPSGANDPMNDVMAGSPLRLDGAPGPRVLGFVACAAMVRREAFMSVGGFDPLVRFPGEEEPVALRLAAAGWAVVYVDSLIVHHHPSPSRADPAARAAAVAQSSLTTALLLRPWPQVTRHALALWRGGPAQRRGMLRALSATLPALRRRHSVPESVRRDLELVAAGAAQ